MISSPIRSGFDHELLVIDDDVDLDLVVGMSLAAYEDRPPARRVEDHPGDRVGYTLTDAAEQCLARFAALESDVTSRERIGHGRVSAARFPRLGGVLHGRVAPGTRAAALLTIGVERTIRAGYQAALATHQVANVPVEHVDVDALWAAFGPISYRIPRPVVAMTWDVCQFGEFWTNLLVELGLDSDARRFAKGQVSPLSRSIRGLGTVGVALALTERGGRRRRRGAAYRLPRTPRRCRELAPVPQDTVRHG